MEYWSHVQSIGPSTASDEDIRRNEKGRSILSSPFVFLFFLFHKFRLLLLIFGSNLLAYFRLLMNNMDSNYLHLPVPN
jgi:hypothetical protein